MPPDLSHLTSALSYHLLQHDVAHITFSVRNGKALLRPCVIHDPDSYAGIHTLSWHGS
ncbi:hypothetical protein MJL33_31480, partial [Salmonella enterica subsp. enterica serovar Kentucky]|nr:hypothetical protein [Salmonella enterica subsp. enterica serovar Kentucky]